MDGLEHKCTRIVGYTLICCPLHYNNWISKSTVFDFGADVEKQKRHIQYTWTVVLFNISELKITSSSEIDLCVGLFLPRTSGNNTIGLR